MLVEAETNGGSMGIYTLYKYIMIYKICVLIFILVISFGIEWDISGFNGILM